MAATAIRYLCGLDHEWRGAYISHWLARAGIRESRRWIGQYVLRGQDLLKCRRFDDEIALATWPMEMRETAKGPKMKFSKQDLPAGIPLRCLKPAGLDRLFVAGRCTSADHEAQASIRVMGTCFATGEAAGRAAAQCLRWLEIHGRWRFPRSSNEPHRFFYPCPEGVGLGFYRFIKINIRQSYQASFISLTKPGADE